MESVLTWTTRDVQSIFQSVVAVVTVILHMLILLKNRKSITTMKQMHSKQNAEHELLEINNYSKHSVRRSLSKNLVDVFCMFVSFYE